MIDVQLRASAVSTSDVTVESLLALKKKFQAIKKPSFDAIVCMPEGERRLKQKIPAACSPAVDRVSGIDLYFEPTREAAIARMIELVQQGRSPKLFEG